jgi:hypothetical protein
MKCDQVSGTDQATVHTKIRPSRARAFDDRDLAYFANDIIVLVKSFSWANLPDLGKSLGKLYVRT